MSYLTIIHILEFYFFRIEFVNISNHFSDLLYTILSLKSVVKRKEALSSVVIIFATFSESFITDTSELLFFIVWTWFFFSSIFLQPRPVRDLCVLLQTVKEGTLLNDQENDLVEACLWWGRLKDCGWSLLGVTHSTGYIFTVFFFSVLYRVWRTDGEKWALSNSTFQRKFFTFELLSYHYY